ncbi:serine/threonine protein kinase [Neisseria sp. HSC-16F19]|nr:serine/threonine-protein kinase [Neisseria sp. HSC-16F19]MCP2041024.1 serine/threonine protein kinase [Neisseria sp. HSC-16F19]
MTQHSVHRADALVAGSQLHTYIILKVIGSGAFGITYLAEHVHLGSQHVIKEYFPDSGVRLQGHTVQAKSSSDEELFNWGLESFFNEAKLLYGLNHPHIVKVTDLFEANGTAYFVMPYLRGITLHEWIKQHPKPREEELCGVFIPLLEGLKYIHERQLLHRDIKPENIFITDQHIPVLIDFGAARQAIGQKSRPLTQILTPPFAPIEQYHSRDTFMPALDLYSLGACIYQAVTRKLIEEAPARISGDDTQPKLAGSTYEGQYSHHFLAAVDYALNVRAENRFQSAMDMQQALLGLAPLPTQSAATAVPPPRTAAPAAAAAAKGSHKINLKAKPAPAPSGGTNWWLWGGLGGVLLLAVVAVALMLIGRNSDSVTTPPVQTVGHEDPPITLPGGGSGAETPPGGSSGGSGLTQAEVDEMNSDLPKMLSSEVRWDRVVYAPASNTLFFQLTFVQLDSNSLGAAQIKQMEAILGPEMAKMACADPNVAPWFRQGGVLVLSFSDKKGRHFMDASASNRDC